MHTIQVLLSTYNGEKYIDSQIESILNQKDVDVKLLIRDDGSTDSTPEILREYSSVYPNVSFIRGRNCGVVSSFFRLFELSDPEVSYYALADQDDVWDPDKLKIACDRLDENSPVIPNQPKKRAKRDKKRNEKVNPIPLLYCCASELVDEELEPLSKDEFAYNELIPDFRNAIIENIARGASIVFNKPLMDIVRIPIPKDVYMHDWWLYLAASCFGKVIYDSTPHYKYRQHNDNVLGASGSKIKKASRRLSQSKNNTGHIQKQIASFARIYNIPEDKKEPVDLILNYQKSFKYRKKGFSGKYLFRQNKRDNLIFRLLFFTNHL